MNIPNDLGHPYRLNKFIEYQHKVPAIDPLVLAAYAARHNLSPDERVWLAWLDSATYCEVTAPFLFEQLRYSTLNEARAQAFWDRNKSKLNFNSARRYVKNMDWFVSLVTEFCAQAGPRPWSWLSQYMSPKGSSYERVYKLAIEFRYTGRFAGERFLVALTTLFPAVNFTPPQLMWQQRSNTTSGLMNVFYQDEWADQFDRDGKLTPEQCWWLDNKQREMYRAIRAEYFGDKDLHLIETKLCSFRNLFKGSRYGGYHHDRMLGNLRAYAHHYPGDTLWKKLYQIRKQLFPAGLLGELSGWNGIRKDRKKLWLTTGQTGVEEI